jgi:hypothetical protein
LADRTPEIDAKAKDILDRLNEMVHPSSAHRDWSISIPYAHLTDVFDEAMARSTIQTANVVFDLMTAAIVWQFDRLTVSK